MESKKYLLLPDQTEDDENLEDKIPEDFKDRYNQYVEKLKEEKYFANSSSDSNENARVFLFMCLLSKSVKEKSKVNEKTIFELFKNMSYLNQENCFKYLSEEQRLELLCKNIFKNAIISKLVRSTRAYKDFTTITVQKSDKEKLKIWQKLKNSNAKFVTCFALGDSAKSSQVMEMFKGLGKALAWLGGFAVAVIWVPFNILVGLAGSSAPIILPNIVAKFGVGFTTNFLGAICGPYLDSINPLQNFKNFFMLKKFRKINNELEGSVYKVEKENKYDKFKEEFKKEKFDLVNELQFQFIYLNELLKKNKLVNFSLIVYLFNQMDAVTQFQCFKLLDETKKLILLATGVLKPEILELCCKNTDEYKTPILGSKKDFYENLKDEHGIGKKMVAWYRLNKSERPGPAWEIFKGIAKIVLILSAFVFCAMWNPFMPVIISVSGLALFAAFGVACCLSAAAFWFAKLKVPSFLNPMQNFRNAKYLADCQRGSSIENIVLSENNDELNEMQKFIYDKFQNKEEKKKTMAEMAREIILEKKEENDPKKYKRRENKYNSNFYKAEKHQHSYQDLDSQLFVEQVHDQTY